MQIQKFATSVYSILKKPLFPLKYEKKDGIVFWRERILHSLAFLVVYLGFIVFIPSFIASITNDAIIIAYIDTVVYLYLLILFTSKRIHFEFRVINLLIVFYVLSVFLMLILGPYGAGMIWLFCIPLLAGILLGLKPAIRALLVNIGTLFVMGIVVRVDPSPFFLIADYSFDGFIAVSLNFLVINTVLAASTGILLDGLAETMKKEEQLRQKIEEEKNAMQSLKEKAEASDRIKTAFLTNISHDLRTPLNAILGFTQLMSTKKITDENLNKYCSIIMAQGESLLHLINDIIDIAKLEANEIAVNKKHFNLNELLNEISGFYVNQMKLKDNKQVELHMVIDETLPENIYQDAYRLKQILYNLVGNAVKFTYKGKIELGVKKYDSKSVLFYVEDTGIGIPRDKLEIIFERFRQVDDSPTKNFGGAGLGLSICSSLVDLLGGHIWVESEIDNGTIFNFILPIHH
jgi:signal transduction histidine kinase